MIRLLDICFRFGSIIKAGESTSQWFINISAFLVAVSVALITIWIGKKLDEKKRNQELDEIKIFFIKTLDRAILNTVKQVLNYQESYIRQKSNNYDYLFMAHFSFKELHYLSNLNKHELYSAFKINNELNADILMKIFANIDFIEDKINGLKDFDLNFKDYFMISEKKIEKDYFDIQCILLSEKHFFKKRRESIPYTQILHFKNLCKIFISKNNTDDERFNNLSNGRIKSKIIKNIISTKFSSKIMNNETLECFDKEISSKLIEKAMNITSLIATIKANNDELRNSLYGRLKQLEDELEFLIPINEKLTPNTQIKDLKYERITSRS